jgi:pimeloyl-ACP methyl ester carboxylesterase
MRNLILLILFLGLTLAVAAQKSNPMEKYLKTGHLPVNGIDMYYEVHGKGEIPLVLIHGGGSTIESTFGEILPVLTKNNLIIAVELQAHGRTSDRNAPESFEQDADDVATLLKYLKITKANILGFSNGGTTALQISIRHPKLVNKLVVISANYQREGLISGFFEGMQHATIDNMPEPLKASFLKVTPDPKKLQTMFEKDKNRMISFKDILDEAIRAIAASTFVIVADHDVVTVPHAQKMASLLKNAQLAVLPGVHGSLIGEICARETKSHMTEISARLIEDFLNK